MKYITLIILCFILSGCSFFKCIGKCIDSDENIEVISINKECGEIKRPKLYQLNENEHLCSGINVGSINYNYEVMFNYTNQLESIIKCYKSKEK